MAEGLLPAVKVFLDWLRTNPDLIIVCAQVRHSTPTAPFSSQGVRGGWASHSGRGNPLSWAGKDKSYREAPVLRWLLVLFTGQA